MRARVTELHLTCYDGYMAALVLKKWHVSNLESTQENQFVDIVGRKSGILAWVLSLLGVDPTTTFTATNTGVTFHEGSLSGAALAFIPFQNVSSLSWGYFKPWKLALIVFIPSFIISLMFSIWIGSNIITGRGKEETVIGIAIPISVIVGISVSLLYYFLNRLLTVAVTEMAGYTYSIRFKRSIIENVDVNAEQAEQVYKVLRVLLLSANTNQALQPVAVAPVHPSTPPPYETQFTTESPEEIETKANLLLNVAKNHIASGAKKLAIQTLREIIRMYPTSRAADKARSSLNGR